MTREEVNKNFHKLSVFQGAKSDAANIFGCTLQSFRDKLGNKDIEQDTLMLMNQAIKQAAMNANKRLSEIVVEVSEVTNK